MAAHRGECDLVEAIYDYETGMLDYGFRAVRNSLKAMHQTVTDSLSALMPSRVTLRAINAEASTGCAAVEAPERALLAGG